MFLLGSRMLMMTRSDRDGISLNLSAREFLGAGQKFG